MGWLGYFTYDDTEIINVHRTEVYMDEADDTTWFRPVYNNTTLADVLGEQYGDPVVDEANWYDIDRFASGKFYGFYPTDVRGFEDSSRTSNVTESTIDGGVPGRVRHRTKSLVFSGLILASDGEGADYGLSWLRRALLGKNCSDHLTSDQALGKTLTYYASEPLYNEESQDTISIDRRLKRHLHNVTFNNGPTVLTKNEFTCGGQAWLVTFTAVAGNPYEFGIDKAVIDGWLDPGDIDGTPWAPGVVEGATTGPTSYTDVTCGSNLWAPIFDPLCPALVVPPGPASIPLSCYVPPSVWTRRTITIPKEEIPLWGRVVPTVRIYAFQEMRGIRVRFYEDVSGTDTPTDAPCDYVGDFLVSYLPAGATLIFNAGLETVHVVTSLGRTRRADSLVFGGDGKPHKWPFLSCGHGYTLVLDLDGSPTPPRVDVSLALKVL